MCIKKSFSLRNSALSFNIIFYPSLGIHDAPTFSRVIIDHMIEKALLDLGAGVNLLPYYLYVQLGLGELKPTTIILQLVERFVKIPCGVVEDVLIKVDKFCFPMDFIVLDTHSFQNLRNQILVILGCQFFTTSNAIINC